MLEQFSPQLQVALLSVARLAAWLVTLAVLFVPLEQLFAARPDKILRKGIATDLGYYFLNSLTTAAFMSVPVALLAWFVHLAIPHSFLQWSSSLPFWARVVLGFVAGEVGSYWGHRISHESPFLWRFHAIHHSAEHLDFLVNTRAHPVDMVFVRFCGLIPIYALGLGGPAAGVSGIQVPVAVTLIATIWGYFIHANLRLRFGPLEWLISTPAFHHWHHTLTPINRNYASMLPWIDRIFGTYYLPSKELPKTYGISSKMPESILDQLAYPLDPPAPAPATTDQTDPQSQNDFVIRDQTTSSTQDGLSAEVTVMNK